MSHSLQNLARRLSLKYLNLPSSVLPATPTTLFFEVHNLRRCLPPVALLKASSVFLRIYTFMFIKASTHNLARTCKQLHHRLNPELWKLGTATPGAKDEFYTAQL